MRAKRIYRLGFIAIVIICLFDPFYLILNGCRTKGKVVGTSTITAKGVESSSNPLNPVVEFSDCGRIVRFETIENLPVALGQEVTVAYHPSNPQNAKVLSFGGLFIIPLIQLMACLFLWWAFTSSFKNFLNSKSKIKLTINLNQKARYTNIPHRLRLYIKLGILLFIAGLLAIEINLIVLYVHNSLASEAILVATPIVLLLMAALTLEFRKI